MTRDDNLLIVIAVGLGVGAWFLLRRQEPRDVSHLFYDPGPLEWSASITPGPTWSATPATKTPAQWRAELMPLIRRQEHALAMPPGLLEAVIEKESAFRDDIITGRTEGGAGEQGIMQLKPQFHMDSSAERNNPYLAIPYGAGYLAKNFLRFGTWRDAVAAYNCGPTAWAAGGYDACSAPGTVRNYVAFVEGRVGSLA